MRLRCGSVKQIVAKIQSCFSFLCSWLHSRTFLSLSSLLLVVGGSVEMFAFAELSELKWCWAVTEGAIWGGWERGLEGKEKSRRRAGRNRAGCLIVIVLPALANGSVQSRLKGFAQGYGEEAKSVCQCPDPPTLVVESPSPDSGALLHLRGDVAPPWQRPWVCRESAAKPLHFGAVLGTVLIRHESKRHCCFSFQFHVPREHVRVCVLRAITFRNYHSTYKIALLKPIQILLMTCNLGAKWNR